MSDWISVKDRLPEADQPFWFYRQTATLPITIMPSGVALPRDYFSWRHEITHWMPATLPEPPKNAEDKAFEKWLTEQPESLFSGPGLALRTAFLAGWQAHEKRGEG